MKRTVSALLGGLVAFGLGTAVVQAEILAIVRNSLLNLPGMSDGSATVIDLNKQEVIASIDTFKEQGFNPNLIVLLPEWNDPAGH